MNNHASPSSPPINVHLRSEDSEGTLAVIEFAAAARSDGPPLHTHPSHGEGFYVLEGEVTFQVRDEIFTGTAGTFAYAAPGTPHTFANHTDRDARLLVLCAPAGFESYFDRLAAQLAEGVQPTARPDPDLAIRVGPPLSAPPRALGGNRP